MLISSDAILNTSPDPTIALYRTIHLILSALYFYIPVERTILSKYIRINIRLSNFTVVYSHMLSKYMRIKIRLRAVYNNFNVSKISFSLSPQWLLYAKYQKSKDKENSTSDLKNQKSSMYIKYRCTMSLYCIQRKHDWAVKLRFKMYFKEF